VTTLNIVDFGASLAVDNLAAIQAAMDKAQGGDIVYVPREVYSISVETGGVRMKSGVTLQNDGVLAAIATNKETYTIINVSDVENVVIKNNSVIVGERLTHTGTWGGWGMGVHIERSRAVKVQGGVITKCWGDGIYVDRDSKDITIDSVTCNWNRRQGMSVVCVDGLTVVNSTFASNGIAMEGRAGTPPGAGIDFEPDDPAMQYVRNVQVRGCRFAGNASAGILFGAGIENVSNVVIDPTNVFARRECPIDGDGTRAWYAHVARQICGRLPCYDWWGYARSLSI
jgi:hypothetical protein